MNSLTRLQNFRQDISKSNPSLQDAIVNLHDLYYCFKHNTENYSDNTIASYISQFKQFIDFCSSLNRSPLPADDTTVELYLNQRMDAAISLQTIKNTVSSISACHQILNKEDPCKSNHIKRAIQRYTRTITVAQVQNIPIRVTGDDELSYVLYGKLIDHSPDTLVGLRNRALLSLAMNSGLRRHELVRVKWDHIKLSEKGKGALVYVPISKTDQRGEGSIRAISLNCYNQVKEWVDTYPQLLEQPVFCKVFKGPKNNISTNPLAPGSVAQIFKRMSLDAGYSPDVVRHVAGHSTRIGLAQELALAGHDAIAIAQALDWKNVNMVLRYIRHIIAEENAAAKTLTDIFPNK